MQQFSFPIRFVGTIAELDDFITSIPAYLRRKK
jgi:hypothetical protein